MTAGGTGLNNRATPVTPISTCQSFGTGAGAMPASLESLDSLHESSLQASSHLRDRGRQVQDGLQTDPGDQGAELHLSALGGIQSRVTLTRLSGDGITAAPAANQQAPSQPNGVQWGPIEVRFTGANRRGW
jgi:hypothetical protein